MKNGIYYSAGPDMFIRVGSEPLDAEDIQDLTHVEFWHYGKLVSRQEKDAVSYETLLGLVKKMEDEDKSVPQVLFELVGI